MSCIYTDCINAISKCSLCKRSGKETELDFYKQAKKPNVKDTKGRTNRANGIRAERVIANKFGGYVVPASGAMSSVYAGLAGDVVFPSVNVLAQSKTKSKRGKDEIRINKDWIDKHWEQSRKANRIPVLIFSFYSKERFWAITEADDCTDTILIRVCNKSINIVRESLQNLPIYFWFKDEYKLYKIVPCEEFFQEIQCQIESELQR